MANLDGVVKGTGAGTRASRRLSVVIATYQRGRVVVSAVERLLALSVLPAEILVVDQTRSHDPEVEARLAKWDATGEIRWLRLEQPSVPHALNEGLRLARTPLVLFLDDDVVPRHDLVEVHEAAHEDSVSAVVGQILEVGQRPHHYDESALRRGALRDLEFRFNHDTACLVENVMAGNLSVNVARALEAGAFDENYIGAAYRFETDFARRVVDAGGLIRFEPRASVDHLKVATGGVRAWGDHRSTLSPAHAVGDYYFALRHVPKFWRYAGRRFVKNTVTRYLVRRPWHIPFKAIAEVRGLMLARRLSSSSRPGTGAQS
jgi:GT2 family glycosyltransferase